MTESAYSSIRGAEISERSTELVLPSSPGGPARDASDESASGAASGHGASAASFSDPRDDSALAATSATPPRERGGHALPGDRGPRDLESGPQRPSFWRRIALGRRTQALRAAQQEVSMAANAPSTLRTSSAGLEPRIREERVAVQSADERALVEQDASRAVARANEAIERRIVEPLLQALVSVEAKLERSHVDLLGRSDQVEQRLTQLWDIEEQLGALGEVQESVLQVTEQQRRLESALVAQTRILRWLVGGIILSLSVAAFAVAFLLAFAR